MNRLGLTRDLLRRLMVPLLAIVAATAALGSFTAQRLTDRVFDRWLLDAAHSLSRQVRFEEGRPRVDLTPQAESILAYDEIDRTAYAVVHSGRHLAGRPGIPLRGERVRHYPNGALAYDTVMEGLPISVAQVVVDDGDGHSVLALVAETQKKRHRARDDILLMLLPTVLLMAAAAGAIVLAVRRSLTQLAAIAARWNERSHASLAPIPAVDLPRELLPFGSALNDLLERIRAMLTRERQFAATVAHQLRTPLTGLQLGLARAAEAPDLAATRRVLRELDASTQRSARMVQQLLSLGRLDPETRGDLRPESTDLEALVRDVGQGFLDRALDQGVELELIGPPTPVHVAAQPELIAEAVGNLLDNALRYTPRGGRVWVEVEAAPPALKVCDSGPGVPEAEREAVFERFVRGREARGDGTGLGLAIVREIAALHGAGVALGASPAGGACVTLRFAEG
ncbi:sensor histidine kinase [Aquabacterium sp. J223]|uniref:sensor histidine kinase n=1 Tax=Aquabacterium sp. J223 TaxID=2898431 RepID=UPI0021AE2B85|nr:sensor histidine kinase [Aquabacterium sp. J223]UUX97222.1 sensor histidine kinase N-terminal domain-containing protein [Aquabacterium sp. J223]